MQMFGLYCAIIVFVVMAVWLWLNDEKIKWLEDSVTRLENERNKWIETAHKSESRIARAREVSSSPRYINDIGMSLITRCLDGTDGATKEKTKQTSCPSCQH